MLEHKYNLGDTVWLISHLPVMLEHKYNLGDTVWLISRLPVPERVLEDCEECGGDGKHTWSSGKTKSCTYCRGTGTTTKYQYRMWRLDHERHYGPLTIGQVRAKCDSRGLRVKYMCEETGIGTGTLWPEAQLWPSKEEAQAECDRLNAEAE